MIIIHWRIAPNLQFGAIQKGEEMPYVRIWVHCVWSTKYRMPVMADEWRGQLMSHICENAIAKGIWIDIINGVADHLHALISLSNTQSISQVLKLIKGESAMWANRTGVSRDHFAWQEEYYAVSVSDSDVDHVRWYIRNQVQHHRKKTFHDECEDLDHQYGFGRYRDRGGVQQ